MLRAQSAPAPIRRWRTTRTLLATDARLIVEITEADAKALEIAGWARVAAVIPHASADPAGSPSPALDADGLRRA